MFRSITRSSRRNFAALLLAFSIAPTPIHAAETSPARALSAQFSPFANRSRMIQISLVCVAAGIALLYKK